MVIPANRVHLASKLQPLGIGLAAKCKINANIGNSAVTSDLQIEMEKLQTSVKFGADTVMDLSTGKDIDSGVQSLFCDFNPVAVSATFTGLDKDPSVPFYVLKIPPNFLKELIDRYVKASGIPRQARDDTRNETSKSQKKQ